MKIISSSIFLIFLSISSCFDSPYQHIDSSKNIEISKELSIKRPSDHILSRFIPPAGFERNEVSKNSFSEYLRNFKLLPSGEKVHLYDGSIKNNQSAHAAILDIDVGHRDLQQCADAVMRLKSEYQYQNELYNKIAFNFTNGWKFEYHKWRDGNELIVKGNKTNWTSGDGRKEGYKEFRKYLNQVFMYAGTLSLSKELKSKPLEEVEIGDVIIQGGSPGHAVIVVDLCVNFENGDMAILLAQSYMPAQQIHILKNPSNITESPWYKLSEIGNQIITPEWTFDRNQVMSF